MKTMPDRDTTKRMFTHMINMMEQHDTMTISCGDPLIELLKDVRELLNEQEDLGTELTNAVELIHKKNKRIEELLKEQEAVEPVLIREGRNKNYNDYVCPRCDNEVVYEQNYCSECGVRFLWEGR